MAIISEERPHRDGQRKLLRDQQYSAPLRKQTVCNLVRILIELATAQPPMRDVGGLKCGAFGRRMGRQLR